MVGGKLKARWLRLCQDPAVGPRNYGKPKKCGGQGKNIAYKVEGKEVPIKAKSEPDVWAQAFS